LRRQFAEAFRLKPVLWEWEPLTAGEHFQAKITPPSATDVVVVILWSRLGVPLPVDRFPGRLSSGQVTGTEWEFEDALASYRERGAPDILVYTRRAPVPASFDDPDDPVLEALREGESAAGTPDSRTLSVGQRRRRTGVAIASGSLTDQARRVFVLVGDSVGLNGAVRLLPERESARSRAIELRWNLRRRGRFEVPQFAVRLSRQAGRCVVDRPDEPFPFGLG
jgi:hypothetical protein